MYVEIAPVLDAVQEVLPDGLTLELEGISLGIARLRVRGVCAFHGEVGGLRNTVRDFLLRRLNDLEDVIVRFADADE